MENESNISGISENLAESIAEQSTLEKLDFTQGAFFGKRIAISVSNSEDLDQLGLSENHVKDISIEIARYLIVNGAQLLYGGDLRNGGYTDLFAELSYQYKYINDRGKNFVNYFPFPMSKILTTDVLAKFHQKHVEAKRLPIPKHLGKIDEDRKLEPFKKIDDRFVITECLGDMRIQMANDSDARIVLGGASKKLYWICAWNN